MQRPPAGAGGRNIPLSVGSGEARAVPRADVPARHAAPLVAERAANDDAPAPPRVATGEDRHGPVLVLVPQPEHGPEDDHPLVDPVDEAVRQGKATGEGRERAEPEQVEPHG